MPKDRFYRLLIGVLAGALTVLVVIGYDVWTQIQAGERSGPPAARGTGVGGPFTLVNHHGETVTDSDFADDYMLIYFGFTYCPDVCPTELSVVSAAVEQLEAPDEVVPIFITVDPERDTPEALADYVTLFHPRMVGLTGTEEQVAEAARAYRVFYQRVESQEFEDYLMDHSSFIYFVDRQGTARLVFPYGTGAADIAADIAEAIEEDRNAAATSL
ncbi:MAG: SCO family protein [Pseudomonadota bacterium]